MGVKPRLEAGLVASGLFLALLLLTICSQGDLWLDEIWSLSFAENASSWQEIFTKYHHDNNHLINTLYLYLIGPQKHFFLYRLLSIISGVGSLFIMYRLARKQGPGAAVLILLLAGTCYPLVLYFSEARGYAPAIFCSLFAFWLLQKHHHNMSANGIILFNIVLITGILSHFSFIIILFSLCCFSLLRSIRRAEPYSCRLRFLGKLYFIPLSILAVIYLLYIRGMAIGGGDEVNYFKTISYATTLLLGLPDTGYFRFVSLFCYAGVVITGAYVLIRERKEEWSLYVMTLFLAPLLILLITQPQVLYFRYFAVCFPFFYLLVVKIFSVLYRAKSRLYHVLIYTLTAIMVSGQIARLQQLVSYGRGSYREAMAYLSDNTSGTKLLIGSDHDFRNKIVLSFYARFLPPQKQFEYIEQNSWTTTAPEWLFSHSQDEAWQPSPELSFEGVGSYQLQRQFKSSHDSGWDWYLYRRTTQTPDSRRDL